ncbi:MAG: hypothetical protein V4646_13830 [Pseudomonadota bacterium]
MQSEPSPGVMDDPVNPAGRPEWLEGLKQGVLIAVAVLVLILPPAAGGLSGVSGSGHGHFPRYADFSGEPASDDARFVANWVADSGDNRNLSFVIIDKKNTRVFVFDAAGKILGATPVLLGAAPGDDSVTGIGKRPIAEVRPEERTTPAGRFMGEPGRNASGEDVVWVDYDAAVSMHRVRIVDPKERRLERLATPGTDDNRISFGCINVPVAFFENVLSPVFKARYGMVYVLPEVKSVREVFTSAYDPAEKFGALAPGPAPRRG